MTGVSDYATAGDVADRAGCSDDGARDALTQLVEMGIIEKRDGRPVEYRRNDSYFRWKRIEELARENSAAILRSQIDELVEEDEGFRSVSARQTQIRSLLQNSKPLTTTKFTIGGKP